MIPSSFLLIHRATGLPTPFTSPSEPLPPQAATSHSLPICRNSYEQVFASSLEDHHYPSGLQRDQPGPQLTPFLWVQKYLPQLGQPSCPGVHKNRGARAQC